MGTNHVLDASAFHVGAAATTSAQHIIYNSSTGNLHFDDDGSGAHAAQQFAHLSAGLALTNADFFVAQMAGADPVTATNAKELHTSIAVLRWLDRHDATSVRFVLRLAETPAPAGFRFITPQLLLPKIERHDPSAVFPEMLIKGRLDVGGTEGEMNSDFTKARALLMRAHKCLGGNDDMSRETAEVLDCLVINLAAAEFSSLLALRPFRESSGKRQSAPRKITT